MSKKRERIFNGEEPAHPLLTATYEDIQSNPLHAFTALRYCLLGASHRTDSDGNNWEHLRMPTPVADYLLKSVDQLLSIQKPNKECPELVAEAFGISAVNFSSLGQDQWEGEIYYEVERLMAEGLKKDDAIDQVAQQLQLDPEALRERYKFILKSFNVFDRVIRKVTNMIEQGAEFSDAVETVAQQENLDPVALKTYCQNKRLEGPAPGGE